ncbi:MAG: pyridoxal-phosphate-dependent aminotransferase family protein [Candidatus Helarchaeota archaeon]
MEYKSPPVLMIPGPVYMHPRIYEAMTRPLIGHRTPEFGKFFEETLKMFKDLLHTKNEVFFFTGSSTSAMDSAIANTVSRGEKVLNIVQGKFSERWLEITKAYGGEPIILDIDWGKAVRGENIAEVLEKHKDIKFVTIVHNETSTGILNPAEEIGKVVREYDRILIVDAVTSVGGDYVFPDKWNFDILVTGSQKCIGIPPGLGMIMVGQRAWDVIESRDFIPSYYVNLLKYRENHIPFTPSIPHIYALNETLKLINEEGFENRVKRHRHMARATRSGIKAMGLPLFADEKFASNTVTAVKYPNEINDIEFRKILQEKGVLVAGGQGKVKGKIFRIAHMNVVTEREILETLSLIELTLRQIGFLKDLGKGVIAADEIFFQNKK